MSTPSSTPATTGALYGAHFLEANKRLFTRWADTEGRASRSECWWVILTNSILNLIFQVSETWYGFPEWATIIVNLILFIPMLTLHIRRLHDTKKSGWWVLIGLIPIIGGIILLIMLAMPTVPPSSGEHAEQHKL